MPSHLSSSDAYFAPAGDFKKKYGTFTDPAIVGDYISEMINGRKPAHGEKFETTINHLTQAFEKSPAAEKAFYTLLDECRAFGLVQMTLRRARHSEYHTAEHAAELGDDTEVTLMDQYKNDFPADKANRLFAMLAKTAASWHDIVQDRGAPPANEVESAVQFAMRMTEMLADYKQKFPPMIAAIEDFEKELDFLSKELIIYDTWLVFGMEPGMTLVAKPLNQRAEQVLADLNEQKSPDEKHILADTPHMRRLYAASDVISKGDTKRFAMEHVLKDQIVLKALRDFPEENQKLLEGFFQQANINTDRDKEQFLGLMCQNIRIFPELNRPEDKSESKSVPEKSISADDHDAYVKVCGDLRASTSYSLSRNRSLSTNSMFENFMNAENLQGKSNITREISFAKAQRDPMWDLHAEHLHVFANFVKQLKATDMKANDMLAESLIVLATRYQPGSFLLKKDKVFHAQLREVESWQKDLAIKKIGSNKVAPRPFQPVMPPSQNATALIYSVHGLHAYPLPPQAKTNLDFSLKRFAGSYILNLISRFKKSSSFSGAQNSVPVVAAKDIFRNDPSKLLSKSDTSSNRQSSVHENSYLESRQRDDSNSVFKSSLKRSPSTQTGRQILRTSIAEEDNMDSSSTSRPKK